MADFRRCFLAFAALILVLGCVAPASAQITTFGCTANAAVPPTLRAEGLTELVGDIVMNCTGGTPTATGTPIPQANFTVYLPYAVTSRVIGSATEALLLIDEPSAMQQKLCPTPTNGLLCQVPSGDNGASFATNGQWNTFQGILTGPNAVTFLGVPVDPPSTSGAPSRVYRITNVRTNANAYPVGGNGVSPVQAYVSISSSTSIAINNPEPIVGFIANGLVYNGATASTGIPVKAGTTGFLQCEDSEGIPGTAWFTENFATAFKTRDANTTSGGQFVPGAIYNTESGLIVPIGTAYAGLADAGTRLKLVFANLPHGITLSVPTMLTDAVGGEAVLVASNGATVGYDDVADTVPNSTFGGPTALTSGTLTVTYASAAADTGSAAAVYEVVAANPNAVDSFGVPISVSYTGAPGNPGSPDVTGANPQASVVGSFAPTAGGGSFTLATGVYAQPEPWPIPRFVDSPQTPGTGLFSISLCQTILLFPYVTDWPGFDTGIAISNTSADPLGANSASPQTGACTVTFYGGVTDTAGAFVDTSVNLNGSSGGYSTTAANTFTTGVVGPGQTWAFSVSAIDSTLGTSTFQGFVGYAIAQCNFQYAHGYSFVSDYGLRNFAAAYLALIIPDTLRTPVPHACSSVLAPNWICLPTGEQLVH